MSLTGLRLLLHKRGLFFLAVGLLGLLSLAFLACSSNNSEKTPTATQSATNVTAFCPPAGSANALTGAGATFPFPLYSKWIDQYNKLCSVKINYQSIGSGGGINQITQKTVDYGASDGIMTAQQESAAVAAGGPIMHIPMTSGAVAVVVNLSGIQRGQLKLSSDVLADIYLKKITKWNDARITALNTGVNLPSSDITVAHRSDGSGTTFIFTNYLSKVSQDWKDTVGNATSVKWPGDVGGEGNEGVANQVRQISGAIGYVELAYATQNNLTWAAMKNKGGKFVEPGLDATTAAATGIPLTDDMKVLITDSDNPNAYPIAGFSWVLVYTNQPDPAKGRALAAYLWWSIHDGQAFARDLLYGPLSADVVKKAEAEIKALNCGGTPCLQAS